MIPEKRFLNQIQQVLARLMQPLWLLDTEGTVLLPEENRSKINLPEFMEPGMPVAFVGKTFLMIGITPELILCADAQGAATHDCIVLAGAMVQSMGRGEAPIQSRYDVYRRVLREELAGSELEALAHEHQIEMNRERCVLTFQILQTETETAFNMLEELVPRAGGDLLVEMDRHTVVFLKSMENVESFDELFQLAEAIEQTLLDEAGKGRYGIFPSLCGGGQFLWQIDAEVFKVLCGVRGSQFAKEIEVGIARLITATRHLSDGLQIGKVLLVPLHSLHTLARRHDLRQPPGHVLEFKLPGFTGPDSFFQRRLGLLGLELALLNPLDQHQR